MHNQTAGCQPSEESPDSHESLKQKSLRCGGYKYAYDQDLSRAARPLSSHRGTLGRAEPSIDEQEGKNVEHQCERGRLESRF